MSTDTITASIDFMAIAVSTVKMLLSYIDPLYLGVFMLVAYMIKKPLYKVIDHTILHRKEAKPNMAWVVAIIGVAVAMIFVAFPDVQSNDTMLKIREDGKTVITRAYGMKLFITFCVGTTFHDLIITYIEAALRKLKKE